MKVNNLGACEDQLKSLLALNKMGAEQRSVLNQVMKKLTRANKAGTITRAEAREIVCELAEALVPTQIADE